MTTVSSTTTSSSSAMATATSGSVWIIAEVENSTGTILYSVLGGTGWFLTVLIALIVGTVKRRSRAKRSSKSPKSQDVENKASGIPPAIVKTALVENSPNGGDEPLFQSFSKIRHSNNIIVTQSSSGDANHQSLRTPVGHTNFLSSTEANHSKIMATRSSYGGVDESNIKIIPLAISMQHKRNHSSAASSPCASPDRATPALPLPPLALPEALEGLPEMPDLEDENDFWGPVNMKPPNLPRSSLTPSAKPSRQAPPGRPQLKISVPPASSASNTATPSRARSASSTAALGSGRRNVPKERYILRTDGGSDDSIDSFTGERRKKSKKSGSRSARLVLSPRKSPSNLSASLNTPVSSTPQRRRRAESAPKMEGNLAASKLRQNNDPAIAAAEAKRKRHNKIIYPAFMEIDVDSDLKLGEKISEGGFGILYRARVVDPKLLSVTGEPEVAVKVIKKNPKISAELALQDFFHEVSIIYALQFSRNVIKFYGCTRQPSQTVVTRLYNDSLADLIYAEWQSEPPSDSTYLGLTLDLVNGLNDMHTYGIAHLDVKPPNLLIERVNPKTNYTKIASKLVLCDFGISKVLSKTGDNESEEPSIRGKLRGGARGISFFYAAPESFAMFKIGHNPGGNSDIYKAMDVYSFAVVLYEMLSLSMPWPRSMTHEMVESQVLEGKRPDESKLSHLNGPIFQSLTEVMNQCWKNNPKDRAKLSAVLDTLDLALKRKL